MRVGDVDLSLAGAESWTAILDAERNAAVRAAEQREAASRTAEAERAALARSELAAATEAWERRHERRLARARVMSAWRATRIAERLTTVAVPWPVHLAALVALAALDAFVFSRSAAIVLNVPVDFGNPEFLAGASFGLLAFACGVLLAHSLKRLQLAGAQQRLLTARGDSLGVDAVASVGSPGEAAVTASLFTLFCAASGFVRYEAGTGERSSILLLQLLVPPVVVLVEYFLHDPTAASEPRRSLRLRVAERRVRAAESRVGNPPQAQADLVKEEFAVARAVLVCGLADRGIH